MDIIEKIKNEKLPVIVFGTGIVGEVVYHACCDADIKVECFCDNNLNKTKKPLCGIEVIPAPTLKNRHKDAVFIISAADIKDVVEQLGGLKYSKWYASNELLREFNLYKHNFRVPMEFVEYAVATAILCHDNYLTPGKLFIRSVDIIITERCSLRCKDCSNLMRYYKNPQDCNIGGLIKSIGKFCSIADEVNEFRVIGGEPFMNKDAHLIIKKLIEEPKVRKITIYTNGTIVPREEQIQYLKNNKVLFIITDYGELSGNLNNLIKTLKQNDIAYYAEKARGWTDCAKIIKHNRNILQQKEIFRNCCAKNTITLSDDKLYRCPFSANAARLNAVPDFKNDYVGIFDKTLNVSEIKKKIRIFLLKKDFLETCDYCNGRSFGDTEIQPAVQTKEPLEYRRYN